MLQHGYGETTLIWLYDIHRLVAQKGERIDWNLVISQAKEFKWSYAVYSALSRIQSGFDTPIPGEVLSNLKVSTEGRINRIVENWSLPVKTRTIEEGRKLAAMNWNDRMKLIAALLFPSPDYIYWRYKPNRSWILPFCYLIRWKDILADGIKTIPYIFR